MSGSDFSKDSGLRKRLSAAMEILEQIEELEKAPPEKRSELIYNLLMQAERALHLGQTDEDKANGFYSRSLGTPAGRLKLDVPRDRDGDFRPKVLPAPFQRDSEERLNLLSSLFAAAYSPSATKQVLRSLGMHYSEREMEQIRQEFLAEFEAWITRQLPTDFIAVYVDAYHGQIQEKNRVKKMVVYTVLGVDFEGKKELLGVYLSLGSETKTFWLQVFNDLIDRGLKHLLVLVSDDFSGLRAAVSTLFPKALHQLCFVHLQRNVRRNMGRDDAKEFIHALSQIKLEKDFPSAKERLDELLEAHQNRYPAFIEPLKSRAEHYLAFLHLPEEVRKYFYTTNAVESFHSALERLRLRSGGFFQSAETLKVNVYIHYRRIHQKWLNGIPQVRANLYLLRQRFAQIYGELPGAI